jgi:hypothetical protein
MFRSCLAAAKGDKLALLGSGMRGGQDAVAPNAVYPYTQTITEKEVIRGESRKVPGRTAAAKRFFFVCIPLRAFSYGRALVGVRSRTPVPLDAGLSTLPFARPPHLRVGTRVLQPVQGISDMRNSSAFPLQAACNPQRAPKHREVLHA